jgi:hypothetical protein
MVKLGGTVYFAAREGKSRVEGRGSSDVASVHDHFRAWNLPGPSVLEVLHSRVQRGYIDQLDAFY